MQENDINIAMDIVVKALEAAYDKSKSMGMTPISLENGHPVYAFYALSTNELFNLTDLPKKPETRNDFTKMLHRLAELDVIRCYYLTRPATYLWFIPAFTHPTFEK